MDKNNMNNTTKSNKKQSMTLLSIMFAMIVVMVAIVVAMPIFTRKIQKESADTTIVSGYHLCYCSNEDGSSATECSADNLTSVSYDGVNDPVLTRGQGCTFTPPEDALNITAYLIGGGGGGVGSLVAWDDQKIAEDALLVGQDGIDFDLFKNPPEEYKDVVNQWKTDTESGLRKYLNDLNLEVVLYGAKGQDAPDNGSGYFGQRKNITINLTDAGNSIKKIQKIKPGTSSNDPFPDISSCEGLGDEEKGTCIKGKLSQIRGKSTLEIVYRDGSSTEEEAYGGFSYINCSSEKLGFENLNGLCDNQIIAADTYYGSKADGSYYSANNNGGIKVQKSITNAAFTSQNIVLSMVTLQAVHMGTQAQAGNVTTVQNIQTADPITVSHTNIGNGGHPAEVIYSGGTFLISNTESARGGNTTLELDEAVQIASGGQGANIISSSKKIHTGTARKYPESFNSLNLLKKLDGAAINYTIPDFDIPRQGGQGGRCIDEGARTYTHSSTEHNNPLTNPYIPPEGDEQESEVEGEMRTNSSNGQDAKYPGCGGGSGALSVALTKNNLIINQPANTTDSTSQASIITGTGGWGASGAILFKWTK